MAWIFRRWPVGFDFQFRTHYRDTETGKSRCGKELLGVCLGADGEFPKVECETCFAVLTFMHQS